MDLLEQIEAADNIDLSNPNYLRTLLARLCAYTIVLERRIAALEP